MKKFIALYHLPAEVMAQEENMQMTDAQRDEVMKAWGAWNERCGDLMVDLGAPLGGGESLGSAGKWNQSDKGVSGYSIVQAKDRDAAKALFKDHIHLGWAPGATVELHEVVQM